MPKGIYTRTPRPARDINIAFWAKVEKTETCWLWTGSVRGIGYGQVYLGGGNKERYAHRVSYQMAKGPIAPDLELDHLCRVRRCVNPDHLEAVPQKVNLLRGESLSARNARKTHCKRGHELAGENLFTYRGTRQCRTCQRAKNRAASAARTAGRVQ